MNNNIYFRESKISRKSRDKLNGNISYIDLICPINNYSKTPISLIPINDYKYEKPKRNVDYMKISQKYENKKKNKDLNSNFFNNKFSLLERNGRNKNPKVFRVSVGKLNNLNHRSKSNIVSSKFLDSNNRGIVERRSILKKSFKNPPIIIKKTNSIDKNHENIYTKSNIENKKIIFVESDIMPKKTTTYLEHKIPTENNFNNQNLNKTVSKEINKSSKIYKKQKIENILEKNIVQNTKNIIIKNIVQNKKNLILKNVVQDKNNLIIKNEEVKNAEIIIEKNYKNQIHNLKEEHKKTILNLNNRYEEDIKEKNLIIKNKEVKNSENIIEKNYKNQINNLKEENEKKILNLNIKYEEDIKEKNNIINELKNILNEKKLMIDKLKNETNEFKNNFIKKKKSIHELKKENENLKKNNLKHSQKLKESFFEENNKLKKELEKNNKLEKELENKKNQLEKLMKKNIDTDHLKITNKILGDQSKSIKKEFDLITDHLKKDLEKLKKENFNLKNSAQKLITEVNSLRLNKNPNVLQMQKDIERYKKEINELKKNKFFDGKYLNKDSEIINELRKKVFMGGIRLVACLSEIERLRNYKNLINR